MQRQDQPGKGYVLVVAHLRRDDLGLVDRNRRRRWIAKRFVLFAYRHVDDGCQRVP